MNDKIGKTNIGCNGILIKDNKVLLGLRKNCFGEGTYGLPGGHLDYREKLADAMKREVKEETGIEVTRSELVSVLDQIRDTDHYVQVNFLITNYSGEIQNIEPDMCEGWEWFDLNQLPENMFWPHTAVLNAYKQKLFYL